MRLRTDVTLGTVSMLETKEKRKLLKIVYHY